MPNCFDTTGCARVRVVAIVETSTSFEAFRKKNKKKSFFSVNHYITNMIKSLVP